MSQSDYYMEQVERRKHEDGEGRWWIRRGEDLEGPYESEAAVDEILWNEALSSGFVSVP